MRRSTIYLLPVVLVLGLAACKDDTAYTTQIAQMKDSIFNAYPTNVASVYIKVEDKTSLRIVLGGGELYKSAPDERQKMATSLGQMALRIFGRDSYLQTGQLVLTKDERNSSEAPVDGIASPINLDSLKKVMGN